MRGSAGTQVEGGEGGLGARGQGLGQAVGIWDRQQQQVVPSPPVVGLAFAEHVFEQILLQDMLHVSEPACNPPPHVLGFWQHLAMGWVGFQCHGTASVVCSADPSHPRCAGCLTAQTGAGMAAMAPVSAHWGAGMCLNACIHWVHQVVFLVLTLV